MGSSISCMFCDILRRWREKSDLHSKGAKTGRVLGLNIKHRTVDLFTGLNRNRNKLYWK